MISVQRTNITTERIGRTFESRELLLLLGFTALPTEREEGGHLVGDLSFLRFLASHLRNPDLSSFIFAIGHCWELFLSMTCSFSGSWDYCFCERSSGSESTLSPTLVGSWRSFLIEDGFPSSSSSVFLLPLHGSAPVPGFGAFLGGSEKILVETGSSVFLSSMLPEEGCRKVSSCFFGATPFAVAESVCSLELGS